MSTSPEPAETDTFRLARIEARLTRLENQFGLAPSAPATVSASSETRRAPPIEPNRLTDEALEFEVGQNWFARVGIIILILGAGFTLSLPYAGVPAVVPALVGWVAAAGLFLADRIWREPLATMAGQLRGAAMALGFLATLRLYFFSAQPALAADTVPGLAFLAVVVAANGILAWRDGSPWLAALAILIGCSATVAAGSAGFALASLLALCAFTIGASRRGQWPALVMTVTPVLHLTYLIWALNDPCLGRSAHFLDSPLLAPATVLVSVLLLAQGPLWRQNPGEEDGFSNVSALLNCGFGYGVFWAHTLAAYAAWFVAAQTVASLVFLALAAAFWVRGRSRVATFFYAMTGYLALTMAIVKGAGVPGVFVWLSIQSVVVVATAIWFRSRFIVVANFFIYAAIVLAYVFATDRESGISLGFGIVALLSARILHWQKDRLELRTEFMRNAYLASAFLVFPYALYHLVPGRFVGVAWITLALFYYALSRLIRSQKFRWMGHATLLLTTLYLVVIGTSQFEPLYRVVSFLVLGTVLLLVSWSFARRRRPTAKAAGPD